MVEGIRTCAYCGRYFMPVRSNHYFCCHRCSVSARYYKLKVSNEIEKRKEEQVSFEEEYKRNVEKSNSRRNYTIYNRDVSMKEKEARKVGMNYGEIVAKEYSEQHPWKRPEIKEGK